MREREKEIKTGRAGGDNDGVSEYTVCNVYLNKGASEYTGCI